MNAHPTTASLILEKFHDPAFDPEIDVNQVTIVGTGGICLWERLWCRILHPESPLPHLQPAPEEDRTMRAMRLAASLAREHQVRLHGATHRFFDFSLDAILMRRRFREEMEKAGISLPELPKQPQSSANRFARKYPDWSRRSQELTNIATDTLELGQHLALLAILQDDAPALQQALETISNAPCWFNQQVRELDPNPGRPRPPRWDPAGSPQELAAERLAYVQSIAGSGPRNSRAAVATAVVARDLHRIDRTNLDLLYSMERCYTRSALRSLNDEVFQEDREGLRQEAVEALTSGEHDRTAQVMNRIREIAAWIARETQRDGGAVEARVMQRRQEPFNLTSINETQQRLPTSQNPLEPVREALTGSFNRHAAAVFQASQKAEQNPETRGPNNPDPRVIANLELDQALTMDELLQGLAREHTG